MRTLIAACLFSAVLVLAGWATAPAQTSIGGQVIIPNINAPGDRLIQGPLGMRLVGGRIVWTPTAVDVGSHDVVYVQGGRILYRSVTVN